jgi:hypothetical protein
VIIGLHVLLLIWEDSLSSTYLFAGIAAHGIYLLLLKDFPFIELTNPRFILAAGIFLHLNPHLHLFSLES